VFFIDSSRPRQSADRHPRRQHHHPIRKPTQCTRPVGGLGRLGGQHRELSIMPEPFATRLGHVLKSLLTAPDGESYAPGRIMGFVVFFIGQAITVFVVLQVAEHQPPVSVSDWMGLLIGVAGFEAAICGTAIGLVLGMAPTDSGGKWWDKGASPPPPPTDQPPTKQP
jgi:hypothetical protein